MVRDLHRAENQPEQSYSERQLYESALDRMAREVAAIEIKAKGETELKPGSYHVMLIDMTQSLSEGEFVPITLRFDDGSSQRIEAPVRKLQSAPPVGKTKEQEVISH